MPRGRPSQIGDETVNKLGYTQVKTSDGWVGKHILIAEETLGRKLRANERAYFKDNDKTNLDSENIGIAITGQGSVLARIAKLQAEIEDRQALIKELERTIKIAS